MNLTDQSGGTHPASAETGGTTSHAIIAREPGNQEYIYLLDDSVRAGLVYTPSAHR